MERVRVVGLSEPVGDSAEVCVGVEVRRDAGEFRVEEVFEALQQYLDDHREELQRRGSQHVRVSLVRGFSPSGKLHWRASGETAASVG